METSMIRNVAFISHGGAGKTSLIEAVLKNRQYRIWNKYDGF